ncbi:hypothetical protein GCM10009639_45270 [Kitasatospora putterlickiae]|uniref:Uncharacterized protein n=1 Tax=Kitasatospora putterlickiae TaxID=221725 RepID=A0ABN1YA44_9ACTN
MPRKYKRSNSVPIEEGAVGSASSSQYAKYPEITSCLTVSVLHDDGSIMGTHMVQVPDESKEQFTPMNALKELGGMIDADRVVRVRIAGDRESWAVNRLQYQPGDPRYGLGGMATDLQLKNEISKLTGIPRDRFDSETVLQFNGDLHVPSKDQNADPDW